MISVIVSTYDRPDALEKVLEGYKLQTFRDFEIVVADDGSGPETKAVVEKAKAAGLPVVHAWHAHDGFRAAAARNMGVRASRGDWIVFADGDCVPFPDFLATYAAARSEGAFLLGERYMLEEDEAARVSVAAVASGEAFAAAPARERSRLRSLARKNAFYAFTGLKKERPKLLTSNAAVSRAAFERVNGLDERFVGWGREDDDLRRRLVRSGVTPRSVVGRANVLHLWHPPVASFKGTVRAGPNEPYFHRGFFLARCRRGLEVRPLASLAVAVTGERAEELRAAVGLTAGTGRPEVEVVLDPGTGAAPRFGREAEVRVLVHAGPPRVAGAHVGIDGVSGFASVKRWFEETL